MFRGILLILFSLFAVPLFGQEEKLLNPREIVLTDRTIDALSKTPEGLFWPFENQSLSAHDGVIVYYDPTNLKATPWQPNDGTVRYPYSLDVNDENLANIKSSPDGLSALIAQEDRERVSGILLRYTRSNLSPDPSITPITNSPAKSNNSQNLDLNQGSNRTTSILNNQFPGNGDLTSSRGNSGLALENKNPPFYADRKTPAALQSNEVFTDRERDKYGPNGLLRNELNNERFALNNDSLMAPPQRTVLPTQSGYTGMESVAPVRRVNEAAPQIGYSDQSWGNNMNAAAHIASNSSLATAINDISQLQLENQNLKAAWAEEAKKLTAENQRLTGVETQLLESKQRSLFLLFMLFLCVGLCIYLAWLARGFYFRYSELADELRETFTTTG